MQGHYEGGGDNQLSMRVASLGNGEILANIQTGVPECMGSFTGRGKLNGKYVVKLSPELASNGGALDPEELACVITVSFAKSGAQAMVSEGDSCTFFHGHKCTLDGPVVRKKKLHAMPNPLPPDWPTGEGK